MHDRTSSNKNLTSKCRERVDGKSSDNFELFELRVLCSARGPGTVAEW